MEEETRDKPLDRKDVVPLEQAVVIRRPYGWISRLASPEEGSERLQFLYMFVLPSKRTSRHSHPCEEVFFVVKGRGTMFHNGVERPLRKGDSVIVLPNEVHQVCNSSKKTTLEVTIAITPPRDPDTIRYFDDL